MGRVLKLLKQRFPAEKPDIDDKTNNNFVHQLTLGETNTFSD
jgi:hypothetical protein